MVIHDWGRQMGFWKQGGVEFGSWLFLCDLSQCPESLSQSLIVDLPQTPRACCKASSDYPLLCNK